jgi:thiol-disulfide isomerase/thioredoxin
VSKWVQGEPVKEFSKDHSYVVEFWATWCGPCRVSIPHLNELHKKFKDKGLIVIGQDVWERDTKLVDPFIKQMGDKMTYRVALDLVSEGENAKGRMAETWMEAAGQNGIPSAFVVNKEGRIAWIGHPMQLKESVLEQVLDGTFDLAKAAADFEARVKRETQMRELYRELNTAMRGKKWDEAEAALAKIENALPEDERGGMGSTHFNIQVGRKDYKAAYALAGKLGVENKDNAMLLNQIAWDIATRRDIEVRNLDVAEKLALLANEAANGRDAAILDTVARVLFMKGEKQKAVEYQQKAVNLAKGKTKERFEAILKSYQAGKLPDGEE